MSKVKIDDVEYDINDLDETQVNYIQELQLIHGELQKVRYLSDMYQDRSETVMSMLKMSLQKLEDKAEVANDLTV